ncbi:hypothetical protein JCM6882_007362 [Rhodosporidiobolus microsporus]
METYQHRLRAARKRRREQVYRSLRKDEEEDGDESSDSTSSGNEAAEPPPPRETAGGGNNKALWAILVLILVVSVGLAAYFLFFRSSSALDGSSGSSDDGPTTKTVTEQASSKTSAAASPSVSADEPPSTSADFSDSSPTSTDTTTATASSSSSDDSSERGTSSSEINNSALKDLGISVFLGNNTGGIASWYHTDADQDSTNGRSWCEFPYDDTVPGFAPSVGTMRSNFDGDDAAAKEAFCGLWAIVYSAKTQTEVKLLIGDGFDDQWIRDEGKKGIDVIHGSFAELFGEETDDKNDVVDVWWMLTGERDEKFTYKGVGVG